MGAVVFVVENTTRRSALLLPGLCKLVFDSLPRDVRDVRVVRVRGCIPPRCSGRVDRTLRSYHGWVGWDAVSIRAPFGVTSIGLIMVASRAPCGVTLIGVAVIVGL